VLGWSREDFYAASWREIHGAFRAWRRANGLEARQTRATRESLDTLKQKYPDMTVH
jgi:hypothetical protein